MQRRITGGQIKIAGHGRHVPILVQDERERGARRPLTYALPSGVSRRVSNSGNKGAYGSTHTISIPQVGPESTFCDLDTRPSTHATLRTRVVLPCVHSSTDDLAPTPVR